MPNKSPREELLMGLIDQETQRLHESTDDFYSSTIILNLLYAELLIEEQRWEQFTHYCNTGRFDD